MAGNWKWASAATAAGAHYCQWAPAEIFLQKRQGVEFFQVWWRAAMPCSPIVPLGPPRPGAGLRLCAPVVGLNENVLTMNSPKLKDRVTSIMASYLAVLTNLA